MSKEVRKWSDSFMFEAEEIDEANGPEVFLLQCNNDPLGSIAAAAKAYMGEFVGSLSEITDDERRHYLAEVQKTALAMPLESVNFHFRIKGVTRGFTHQMVRQRTAAYSQESTRFAVKTGVPVGLPPSLAGTESRESWRADHAQDGFINGKPNREATEEDYLAEEERYASQQQKWRFKWDDMMAGVAKGYNELVNDGMPAEDARGALPTNLLTQLNYFSSMRGLSDHAGMRLCTQAQHEWKVVWVKILEAIVAYGDSQAYAVGSEIKSSAWQFREIAGTFKPKCFQDGSCPFKADFDRKCNIREKVDAYAANGVPSAEWSTGRADLGIPPIHASEWSRSDAAR